jgi:hypothetical protein
MDTRMALRFVADKDVSAEGPTNTPQLMKAITLGQITDSLTMRLVQSYNGLSKTQPECSV